MHRYKPAALCLTAVVALCLTSRTAQAFCGFFVARADASLFNNSSQVVIVHDEGKTVLTMVNDYRGEPRSFALVVPVPVVLSKKLVRVADEKAVARVDAFTAPRLAEYFDPNPCHVRRRYSRRPRAPSAAAAPARETKKKSDRSLGVKVEASFAVGEYDIVILSAKQSDGLETWLRQNKYNIPKGASRALAPYVRSGMKFFVAKVNLKRHAKAGFANLRPLQFAFPDRRFMLPIRLGMLNADGPQDLIAYVITKQHRAEVANYLNPKLPTGQEIPPFVKRDFKRFYRDMFSRQVEKENGRAVFTEYAWNMSWCDPCAADPLTHAELEKLGVWWLSGGSGGRPRRGRRRPRGPQQAFVTRLHVRYTESTFPEDLMLKVTKDSSNYQARFVLRHPYTGGQWCDAMDAYLDRVERRREKEVQTLASLTGWDPGNIRRKLKPLPRRKSERKEDEGWNKRMEELFGK